MSTQNATRAVKISPATLASLRRAGAALTLSDDISASHGTLIAAALVVAIEHPREFAAQVRTIGDDA